MLPSNRERKILYLLLPKDANFIESRQDYTLFSALAEFLGIAGLFFGISAYSLVNTIMSIFSTWFKMTGIRSMCKYMKNSFMIALALTSFAITFWILVVFIDKYMSYPVGSHVSLTKGIPPMSMALCHSKYMTAYSYKNDSYLSVTEDIIFWQDGLDLQKKITRIAIMNSNGEWKTIWDTVNSTLFPENIFSKVIFPLNNQTLQFCDIIDMQQYQDLSKVTNILYFLYVQFLCKLFLR
jgi:hypothetical protein